MKKILSIIMCAMLVFALPCLAVAQTAGAATPEPVQPLDPGDVSWLNTYLDYVIVGICIVIGRWTTNTFLLSSRLWVC